MILNQANQVAFVRCQHSEASLAQLTALVAKQKALAAENKIPDWAHVGDLGRMQSQLNELVEVHGGAQ